MSWIWWLYTKYFRDDMSLFYEEMKTLVQDQNSHTIRSILD